MEQELRLNQTLWNGNQERVFARWSVGNFHVFYVCLNRARLTHWEAIKVKKINK